MKKWKRVTGMKRYKNILLVYPEIPKNTYWSFSYALRFIKKKSSMPPLGLVTIAALLPEDYEAKLVDMNVSALKDDDIKWADAVFISAMIVQKKSFDLVVERCRRFGKTIVAGGPYPTNSWREISGVDHFLLGEVEETLADFMDQLENGNARRVYPMPPHPDISTMPVPRFDLLDLSVYGSMAVQYSRGCPFHCEFCDIWTVYGNRPRVKSALSLLAELETLYKLGWRGAVFVVDDNFIGNKKKVKSDLLPALIEWQESHDRPFNFFTEASINLAEDDDLMDMMRLAGFNQVFIGIETPEKEGLKETGKTQNMRVDMSAAVRRIQKNGMEVMAGFIIGFDNDPDDIFERQIDFIQRNGIPKAMIGLLTALPGTRLFERLKKEKRLIAAPAGNNTHTLTTNFKTKMAPERIREGYKHVLEVLYGKRLANYFKRCNKLLDNLEHAEYFQRKIGWEEIRIFLKSVLTQPFFAYGVNYMKFVLRNLFVHPSVFAEVITLSVVGHHFFKITKTTLKSERISDMLDAQYKNFCAVVTRYMEAAARNTDKRIRYAKKLWRMRNKILYRLYAKIARLQGDIQQDLAAKYARLSESTLELLKNFESNLFPEHNLDKGP